MVKIPTLPANINIIKTIFEPIHNVGVKDKLNPTVDRAEITSNKADLKLTATFPFSIFKIKNKLIKIKMNFLLKTVCFFWKICYNGNPRRFYEVRR